LRIPFKKLTYDNNVPAGNYIVMVLATVTFAIQFTYDYNQQYLTGLILEKWSFSAMLGHMWLHASLLHIICNLIVLWVFGRQVSLKIGSIYPLVYVILGLIAAAAHMLYDGRPAIGASGAIMGILGVHLILCFRQFSPAGPWIILIWFLLNLTIGVTGYLPTAYLAHVGGFFGGIILAGVLVLLRMAECKDADEELLRILQ